MSKRDNRLATFELLLSKDNRQKAKVLLARQAMIVQGIIWDRADQRIQNNYLTLAESMLRAVERMARVSW